MKINNKGFTLVELLAVIVILITILLIAIPSITSSLERSKEKQNQAKYRLIESASEIYISDHKNTLGDTGHVCLSDLKNDGLLIAAELKDSNDDVIDGCVLFDLTASPNVYTFYRQGSGYPSECSICTG